MNLFLTVLKAGKSKVRVPTDSMSETLFLVLRWLFFSLSPHITRDFSQASFVRALIPFIKSKRAFKMSKRTQLSD